jgi:hypothetical protein
LDEVPESGRRGISWGGLDCWSDSGAKSNGVGCQVAVHWVAVFWGSWPGRGRLKGEVPWSVTWVVSGILMKASHNELVCGGVKVMRP